MLSIRRLAEEIVAREGGYVDDPDDPGGATNRGVTIGTLRRLKLDLDGDGQVDERDLRLVTPARAADIFVEHYFRRPRLDLIPTELQPPVFDMQVNAGDTAVRLLQRLLTASGEVCTDDGVVGPQTTAAAARVAARLGGARLAERYGIVRREHYYRIGDARPASRKFCRSRDGGKGGWIIRAETFLPPSLHLTPQQHRARVAAWV